ncbi:MAG: hypothetical protein KDB37_04690, partial [Ilumatobacter sp.]|nr:hypothetical protein [Ilumatobacter sp.]
HDRGGDQRRTVAIAAGVGLVALLLGWVVGRAGGSSDTATAPATTVDVTVPRTTTAPPDDEPRDTIAPVDDPVSRPTLPLVTRPANASDLVEHGATITTTKVGIDERLAGQDVVLVGLVGDGLAELDLGGSTVTDYTLDGLPRSYGPTIVAGADWIVIPMYNGLDPFLVFDDGTVERPDLMPGGNQLLHVTGTDLFWRMPAYWSSDGIELGQVDVAGEPTGVTLELPTNVWPAFADPLGGVIVQASGRWFSVDTEGSSSIGTGDVIALDDDIVLLHDCVALDECGLWRIDRSSGEAVRVPLDLSRLDSPYLGASWWNGDAGSGLSPDARRYVTTIEGDGAPRTVIIDLVTGAITDIEGVRPGPPTMAWTPDGRFVVYLPYDGEPMAYSVATGETFPVVVVGDVTGWDLLATRP